MNGRYILQGHTPVPVDDLMEWANSLGENNRRVALTEFPGGHVSTVFLGLDHSFGSGAPLLFETMIFGGPYDDYQERYSTWEEAETGHQMAVALATSVDPVREDVGDPVVSTRATSSSSFRPPEE